ncbi:MAG: NUDIX hydrolase [Gammaproteobacteria bacterium]|nr:NUDIX hydrolase [Gammaproteobacteria bacterium]
MKNYRLFQTISRHIIGSASLLYAGYTYGRYDATKNPDYSLLKSNQARALLPSLLDAAKVPHGDMAVPSQTVHSRRFFISQWPRSAVGACIMVLGTDDEGDICVAVGHQRGLLRHPQGYMEVRLPKEDLTGLRAKNASRINASTGEAVLIDHSIEDNAVREVYEEIGLTISKSQLKLLSIKSSIQENPVCIAGIYYVMLNNTPNLKTLDHEFADDDLAKPQWIKIKNIIYKEGKYYAYPGSLPFDPATIEQLNAALLTTDHAALYVGDESHSNTGLYQP